MAEKFFSENWLKEAHELERAVTDESYKLLKNPETFSHVLVFEVADHPGVSSSLQFEAGRSVAWTASSVPDDQAWARLVGNLEDWRSCAEGRTSASTQVMSGRIKIAKGDMMDAFANAPALDMLARLFGNVDTDWNL